MTTQSIGRTVAMLFLGVSMLALMGCSHSLVIIHYSQPANAYIFDNDPTGSPHTTTSAGTGMFAFYCINQIENNDTNAKDFKLDLSKIRALNDPSNTPGNTSFNFQVQTAPNTLTVPKHTTSGNVGRIVIAVTGAGDPASLKTQMLDLNYNSSSGESVLIVRDGGSNPPAVKFLDPASPIHPNNLPACP